MATNENDLAWLREPEHHIIVTESDDFPQPLRQIPDPPAQLYVVGNNDALHLPALAMVGSRNPTRGAVGITLSNLPGTLVDRVFVS